MSSPDTSAPLDLSGHWRVGTADEELRRTWYADDFDDADFGDIDVPGHWQSTEGFAHNEAPLLYRRRFSTVHHESGTRAWLCFDGVCTQGDVWLDGVYLGDTEGAWVPHTFEVTESLASRSEHTLGVEVASPPPGDPYAKRTLLGTWQDGPYVRPGWNPGGIWRPVTLRRTGPVAITSHRVLCTAATPARATVTISCALDCATAGDVSIRTTVAGVDHQRTHSLARGANKVTWSVDIADPDLWWPAELGEQKLVEVTVDVHVVRAEGPAEGLAEGLAEPATGDEQSEAASSRSDGFTTRCGLRQVALRDWILTVNGERLFIKGVLAGPAAHELGTAPAEAFTNQIDVAKAAGCNLVRVHAHLSREELYRHADETGMLIWQDLPLYHSQHRSVRRVAAKTAQAAVDALGAHPSIVVWCAHDEPDGAGPPPTDATRPSFLATLASHELPNWNRSVLDASIKRTLVGADPSRPVIGSSGTWPHPPALSGTDMHLDLGWSTGDATDLARLARAVPRTVRFVQITPSPSLPTNSRPVGTTTWPRVDLTRVTQASAVDPELLAERLPPDAFVDFAEWQRALANYQAQLVRIQVETLRRLSYRPTGGFVVAHLADLRPVLSPSLIDHTGAPKPAYEALRAACQPVLVTLDPWPHCAHPRERMRCDVHVVNSLREPLVGARLDVRLSWQDGRQSWSFGGDVTADTCAHVGAIELAVPDNVGRINAEVRLDTDGVRAENRYTTPVHVH